MSRKSFALLCVTLFLLVGLSSQVPIQEQKQHAKTKRNTAVESTTVKILIPPPASALESDSDDDTVVVEAAKDDVSSTESGTGVDEAKEFDPNDCFLEKSKGPCRAVIDSWFFNAATNTCDHFAWSGCGGNNNRFLEKSYCQARCIRSKSTSESDVAASASEPISSSSNTTTADNTTTTTSCPKFDGCGPLKCAVVQDLETGCKKCSCATPHQPHDDTSASNSSPRASNSTNTNASASVPDSVRVSTGGIIVGNPKLPVGSVSGTPSKIGEEDSSETSATEKPEDVCQLPATRGHCRAMMTRWRYDPKVKDCVEFHFGGCDGNSNNFVNKEKCLHFCKGQ